MMIEPWAMGHGMNLPPSSNLMVSIGPIVAGVYVEKMMMVSLTRAIVNIDIQMTHSPSRARRIADMVGEAPLFAQAVGVVASGVAGVACRVTSVNSWSATFAWGFEVLTGQEWINIAVRNEVAAVAYYYFSAFGFRRIKADEDP